MLLFCLCCCVSFCPCCCGIYSRPQQHSLFSVHTVCSKHTVARAAVVVVLFRKLCSLYFSLLKLILYSTQSLCLRKIITNTHIIICEIRYKVFTWYYLSYYFLGVLKMGGGRWFLICSF